MKRRTLAYWLAILGVAQAVLYAAGLRGGPVWLYDFDPRIGWSAFADTLGIGSAWPTPIEWITVGWQILVAAMVFLGMAGAKTYRIGEVLLSLPSILFFVLVLVVNMSPSHGFSARELLGPCIVFAAFTVAPFLSSWWVQEA